MEVGCDIRGSGTEIDRRSMVLSVNFLPVAWQLSLLSLLLSSLVLMLFSSSYPSASSSSLP